MLNRDELAKLGRVLPGWKIKQCTWPGGKEISAKRVKVDERLKLSCMGWLRKFMDSEQLPEDFARHLIAMKNWGLIRKESEQKRLCDVFVARFKKDHYVVHIQESPYNVVIAVADERPANAGAPDHKNLVVRIGGIFLNEVLRPNPKSENLHVSQREADGRKMSKVVWLIDPVATTDEKGRTCGNPLKAREIGASVVRAETDGKFVRFDITKRIKGARGHPDPYLERFKPAKSRSGSAEGNGK
jgi:hypothetical protein